MNPFLNRLVYPSLLFMTIPSPLSAGQRVWDGSDVAFNFWSTAANWAPADNQGNHPVETAPGVFDDLLFPLTSWSHTSANNLAEGLTLGKITLLGDYHINGNSLRLNGGIECGGVFRSATLNLPLTFGQGASIQTGPQYTLVLAGPVGITAHDLTVTGLGTARLEGALGGNRDLRKEGPGTLHLHPAAGSTFSGLMTVHAGLLRLDGSLSAASAEVRESGTLTGEGELEELTVIGGKLSPGHNGHGILTCGDLALKRDPATQASCALSMDVAPAAPFAKRDRVTASRGVVLDGVVMEPLIDPSLAPGVPVILINNTSGAPVAGTFLGLPEGAAKDYGGITLRVTYTGGDGNDVAVTRLPPPVMITGLIPNADGTVRLHVSGPAGQTIFIEACGDLDSWQQVASLLTGPAGTAAWTDNGAPSHPRRFYRCVPP